LAYKKTGNRFFEGNNIIRIAIIHVTMTACNSNWSTSDIRTI